MSGRVTLAILLVWSCVGAHPQGFAADDSATPDAGDQSAIQEAARWIGRPDKVESEYDYVMTCRLRLLLFWTGKDDVGEGYVRIGRASGEDQQQMIQVLFGSDPAKAPLGINRWGAGTVVLRSSASGRTEACAFFGFMKSSKGQSVLAMQKELSKEKASGDHLFEAIMSRVDEGQAITTSVPYKSSQDYDLHQYPEAEKATLEQLENNPARHIRRLDGSERQACPRTGEFLSTTLQLIDDAVGGRPAPISYCYLYNARHYSITLLGLRPIEEKTVHVTLRGNRGSLDRTYRHLKEARFVAECKETSGKSSFGIVLGTEGNLRGTPIQITYEPNWWFQVVLNLVPGSPQFSNSVITSR